MLSDEGLGWWSLLHGNVWSRQLGLEAQGHVLCALAHCCLWPFCHHSRAVTVVFLPLRV